MPVGKWIYFAMLDYHDSTSKANKTVRPKPCFWVKRFFVMVRFVLLRTKKPNAVYFEFNLL